MVVLGIVLLLHVLVAGTVRGQATRVVIVSGLSGEARFAASFGEWSDALARAARERYGVAEVTMLSEKGAGALRATRENVVAAVRAVGNRSAADDELVIVLFGHGSESAGAARLNLSGPDLTAADLAAVLADVRARRITVVNTASASGGFLKPLAGQGRLIITATRSGGEQNETIFPRYFVAALTGTGADTDKDGRVSLLEAFEYARREVERAYGSTQRLQTEHALLEADGDGVGSASPQAASGDGAVAALAFLGNPGAAAGGAATGELRALLEEKRRLESALESLRRRRSELSETDYQRELERLLLSLSRNGQAIRKLQGGSQ